MSSFSRPANSLLAAGDICIDSTGGDIDLKTQSLVRATITNSGTPAFDVFGNVDITGQYLINGTPIGGGGGATFVDLETPAGLINGSNVTYTLANTPIAGSVHLYLNGVVQEASAGNDYTISGATITMLAAPKTSSKLLASYRI